MAGMKISLVSAMRARDVSQPRAADEAAAERTDAATAVSRPKPDTRLAASEQAPAETDVTSESAPPGQHLAAQPQAEDCRQRVSTDRRRGRRR